MVLVLSENDFPTFPEGLKSYVAMPFHNYSYYYLMLLLHLTKQLCSVELKILPFELIFSLKF